MEDLFEVQVEMTFSAAHRLREYGTKCENIHGHNWTVVAVVRSSKLNSKGVCIDFRELKQSLGEVLDRLDHHDLNELPVFRKQNPSAENIARYVYKELSKKINSRRIKLARIKVAESRGCWATYQKR
jgi:6-pyruvoyltetrahydropterin/6-carboxytetrahydropterin synthase